MVQSVTVTAVIETGLIEAKEPETEVVLEAPAGLIRTKAQVKDGKVVSVTLTNVPAFLYKENLKTVVDGREITYDISFGGSFFAIIDAEQPSPESSRRFQDCSVPSGFWNEASGECQQRSKK